MTSAWPPYAVNPVLIESQLVLHAHSECFASGFVQKLSYGERLSYVVFLPYIRVITDRIVRLLLKHKVKLISRSSSENSQILPKDELNPFVVWGIYWILCSWGSVYSVKQVVRFKLGLSNINVLLLSAFLHNNAVAEHYYRTGYFIRVVEAYSKFQMPVSLSDKFNRTWLVPVLRMVSIRYKFKVNLDFVTWKFPLQRLCRWCRDHRIASPWNRFFDFWPSYTLRSAEHYYQPWYFHRVVEAY